MYLSNTYYVLGIVEGISDNNHEQNIALPFKELIIWFSK